MSVAETSAMLRRNASVTGRTGEAYPLQPRRRRDPGPRQGWTSSSASISMSRPSCHMPSGPRSYERMTPTLLNPTSRTRGSQRGCPPPDRSSTDDGPRSAIRCFARTRIASEPMPWLCRVVVRKMSMLAWRYIGSSSSPYWIAPTASPSTSMTKTFASPTNWSSTSVRSTRPHRRATSGSRRMDSSSSTSSVRAGRSTTRGPFSTRPTTELWRGGGGSVRADVYDAKTPNTALGVSEDRGPAHPRDIHRREEDVPSQLFRLSNRLVGVLDAKARDPVRLGSARGPLRSLGTGTDEPTDWCSVHGHHAVRVLIVAKPHHRDPHHLGVERLGLVGVRRHQLVPHEAAVRKWLHRHLDPPSHRVSS